VARAILEVPDELEDSIVAPANCALATIVNVLSELPQPCRTVARAGRRVAGRFCLRVAQPAGVPNIYGCDISEHRLALIRELAHTADCARIRSHWPEALKKLAPHGAPAVDLVVEVAGSAEAISQGMQVLRPGGTYVWAGMVHPETRLALTGEEVVKKCVRIRGCTTTHPPTSRPRCASWRKRATQFPYEKIVSPPLALEELDAAVALSQRREWLRVAVRP
jgi:threonine dehydrogenase-like Zn-dependent dehydrogenase